MPKKYTIEDIAKRAGVSRGTVSRVLNNFPSVSDDTRQAVLSVIDELDYSPNFSARHMRTNSSKLLGLITDEVIETPYAVEIVRGAQEVLREQGKVMLVVDAGYDSDMLEASMEALFERRVEGIIYAAMYHRPVQLPRFSTQIPIVLTNCFSPNGLYSSVVPDEVQGGYVATMHLLSKGHRRIGFINLGKTSRGVPPPLAASTGRLQGYQQALEDYGVPFDEQLLVYTDQSPLANCTLARQLIQMPNRPTAIFAGNDRAAMGCYRAIGELGLKIPDDVAVVGFDNQFDIAQGLWPPLTTVQLPHYEMGKWAVEYLTSMSEAPHIPVQHRIACPLVERESV